MSDLTNAIQQLLRYRRLIDSKIAESVGLLTVDMYYKLSLPDSVNELFEEKTAVDRSIDLLANMDKT